MALRFKSIKNLNCKKLLPDELKDLTFEDAWFSGRFEGEDTDLSDISFRFVNTNAAGVVSFTGILPKDQVGANYGYLIIRDAEIPNFDNQDDPIITGGDDWGYHFVGDIAAIVQARKGIACLPDRIGRLIVHNLKGLDKIGKGLTKRKIAEFYINGWLDFGYGYFHLGDPLIIGSYVGSEEEYKEFNRLCAFREHRLSDDPYSMFVCFTDRNNNVIKGPFERLRDDFKENGNNWEFIEHEELTPVPPGKYKQDEDGFFEEVE